jgi:hypothetical protein
MTVKAGQLLSVADVGPDGRPSGINLSDPGALGVINPLATSSGVNFKVAGATAMFTVPAGYMAVVTGLIFRPTAVTGLSLAATVSLGTDANGSNITTGLVLTGLNVGKTYVNNLTGVYQTPVAGDVIRLNVTAVATATVFTGDVILMGFLLPVLQ